MARVFDSPVTTHGSGEPLHVHGQAADVVTHLDRLLPVTNATGGHHANCHQSLPERESRQALGSRELEIGSRLLAPMTFLYRHMLTSVFHVSIELFICVIDDRLMQRFLVSFKGQNIVGLALDDLRSD